MFLFLSFIFFLPKNWRRGKQILAETVGLLAVVGRGEVVVKRIKG
jgi:hypothetical protein